MIVIILNAGIGSRLGSLTKSSPKCLVKVTKNDSILDLQLKKLIKCNLKEIIMLTGPFEDKIKAHIKKFYPELNIQYIKNERYNETNYIYSLYVARNVIKKDALLLHGDLIFSEDLLVDFITSDSINCVLVNKTIPPPEKDFKAVIESEKIVRIGVNEIGAQRAFLAPLYKLNKQFISAWLNQIERYVKDDKINCYAEDALNEILNDITLKPFYFTKKCLEIDDIEDLEEAKTFFLEL